MTRSERWCRIAAILGAMSAAGCLAACTPAAPPPANCAEAVERANSDPRLRIQGGSEDAIASREIAKVHIYRAQAALAAGDEATCRRELNAVYLR